MCKACVDEGLMTVEELDAAVMAGDQSVIPIMDRIAAGQDPAKVLQELDDMTALTLLFSMWATGEG